MKTVKLIKKALLPIWCFSLMLTACSQEFELEKPGTTSTGGAEPVLLSIEVPEAADGATAGARALTDAGETNIATVDVLQFNPSTNMFVFRAAAYDITGTGATRTFKANLIAGNHNLVVIANARDQVNDAVNGTGGVTAWTTSTTIQDALDRLNITVAKTAKISTGGVLPNLPIFGIAKNINVIKDLKLQGANAVKMVRMLSKIEVMLTKNAASGSPTGSGNGNFKLVNARLYNQALQGWVTPEISSWPTTNLAATNYFGGASAPTKAAFKSGDAPLLYTGSGDNVTDNDILRSIYTFEAPAGSDAGRDNNVCLVVGGNYAGSGSVSYYRVDIRRLEAGGAITYLPLLRNHKYIVNIKSVIGPGYPTPEDAFDGETALMEVDILDWNDGNMSDIIFDGVHYLAINPGEFEFSYAARTDGSTDNKLKIKTDVPAGWTATVCDDIIGTKTTASDWLTLSAYAGSDSEISLRMPENAGADRIAYIHITAGRLTHKVKVTQKTENFSIIASPATLTMPSAISSNEFGVTCFDGAGNPAPAMAWTLTSGNDAWLTLSLSPTGPGAASVSGVGNQIVYIFATANTSTSADRTTNIIWGSSTAVAVTQLKYVDYSTIVNHGAPLPDTYVGAFWRATQKGERVIKIDNISTTNAGAWSASVAWMDGQWGSDKIILEAGGSPDPNIYSTNPLLPPGNAEGYPVTGTATTITGTVAAGESIVFRVGLSTTWSGYDEDTAPARYAVVLLSYKNNSTHQKIYLRQGEGPDEMVAGSGFKYVSHNLSILNGNVGVGTSRDNTCFTEFPTQAGYYFKWVDATQLGFYPTGSISPWPTSTNGWGGSVVVDITYDPCLKIAGYKAPSPASISYSDFGLPSGASGYFTGHYADGWYDRGEITTSSNGIERSRVGDGDKIAYKGYLLIGSGSKTLFFPLAGRRVQADGSLTTTGNGFFYAMNRRGYTNQEHVITSAGSYGPTTSFNNNSVANVVRCVRE